MSTNLERLNEAATWGGVSGVEQEALKTLSEHFNPTQQARVTLELPADAAAIILGDPERFKQYMAEHGFDVAAVMPTPQQGRTQFGYPRTVCSCADCTINCSYIPGYLVPNDLHAIAEHLGVENIVGFAAEYLLASPGATVGCSQTGTHRQIRTLVPARRPNGACKFLTSEGRCSIHTVSPFGCAFFDSHQTMEESNARSLAGLIAIDQEWNNNDSLYAMIWRMLDAAGLRAPSPMLARAKMAAAMAIAANSETGAGDAKN